MAPHQLQRVTSNLFRCKSFSNREIRHTCRLFIDNTTALAYVNNFGGNKPHLNKLARRLWLWLLERRIKVSAAYIKSCDKVQADEASRANYSGPKEWKLHPKVFGEINRLYGPLTHDLMASRLNRQLPLYFSLYPDPDALAVDCFTRRWEGFNAYVFPPFISRRRFEDSEEGEAGGDTTDFSVAFMAPAALVSPSVSLDHSYSIAFTRVQQPADHASGKEHSGRSQEDTGQRSCQTSPHVSKPSSPRQVHPFRRKLKLTVFRISGRSCDVRAFHQRLPRTSSRAGGILQNPSTACTSGNGFTFASNIV